MTIASSAAFIAAFAQYFQERRVYYEEDAEQYRHLLSSDLCTLPTQRMASARVNRCDEAAHFLRLVDPMSQALLDAMQMFAVCGVDNTRCASIAHGLSALGLMVQCIFAALIFAIIWLAYSMYTQNAYRLKTLPLDGDPNYTMRTPLYVTDS